MIKKIIDKLLSFNGEDLKVTELKNNVDIHHEKRCSVLLFERESKNSIKLQIYYEDKNEDKKNYNAIDGSIPINENKFCVSLFDSSEWKDYRYMEHPQATDLDEIKEEILLDFDI